MHLRACVIASIQLTAMHPPDSSACAQKTSKAGPSNASRPEGSTAGNKQGKLPPSRPQEPRATPKRPTTRPMLSVRPQKKGPQQAKAPAPKPPRQASKPAAADKGKSQQAAAAKPAASKSPAAKNTRAPAPAKDKRAPEHDQAARKAPQKPAPTKTHKKAAKPPAPPRKQARAPSPAAASPAASGQVSTSMQGRGHATPGAPAQTGSVTRAEASVPSGSQHADSPPAPLPEQSAEEQEFLYNNPPLPDAAPEDADSGPSAAPGDDVQQQQPQQDTAPASNALPQQGREARRSGRIQATQAEQGAGQAAGGAEQVLSPSLRLQPRNSNSTARAAQPAQASAVPAQPVNQAPAPRSPSVPQQQEHRAQHGSSRPPSEPVHAPRPRSHAPAHSSLLHPQQSGMRGVQAQDTLPMQPQLQLAQAQFQPLAASPRAGASLQLPAGSFQPSRAQALLPGASPMQAYSQQPPAYQGFMGRHAQAGGHAASNTAGLAMLQPGSDDEEAAGLDQPQEAAGRRNLTPFEQGGFRYGRRSANNGHASQDSKPQAAHACSCHGPGAFWYNLASAWLHEGLLRPAVLALWPSARCSCISGRII